MTTQNKTSRRAFFTLGAQSAAVLGLGGLSAQGEGSPSGRPQTITSFPTGAHEARGIAVDDNDHILVAADRILHVFDANGSPRTTFELDGEPICVAAREGRIFIGFRDHIEIFDNAGRRSAIWPAVPGEPGLASLAVAENGEVFASDGGNRVIWRFSPTGQLMGRVSRDGKEFSVPRDFFPIATEGSSVVVANLGRHRIERLTTKGMVESGWGSRSRELDGFGGCCNPISLARTPSGDYITAEGGLPRIKRYDADGHFKELLAGPEQLEANARGSHETTPGLSHSCHAGGLELAVDSRERVLVLDRVTADVRVIAQA